MEGGGDLGDAEGIYYRDCGQWLCRIPYKSVKVIDESPTKIEVTFSRSFYIMWNITMWSSIALMVWYL